MLDIDMEFRKGILFIRLTGCLNEKTSSLLKNKVDHFVKENGIRYITLNLEGLKEINDEVMRIIKEHYQQILSLQSQMILCGIKDKSQSVFLKEIKQSQNELSVLKMMHI